MGQVIVDTFFSTLEARKVDRDSHLYKCSLKNEHSRLGNKHETDHACVSGALKIMNGMEETMTAGEIIACARFLKETDEGDAAAGTETEESSVADILSAAIEGQKAKRAKSNSKYRSLIFILASAAICERLFSKMDALLIKRRSGLTPIMIESLLYLKENRAYCVQDGKG